MPTLDEILTDTQLLKGLAVGLGIAVLVPVAVVALAPMVRPVARSALKAGLLVFEKGREAAAELGEMVDDLVAEVRDELKEPASVMVSAASGLEGNPAAPSNPPV